MAGGSELPTSWRPFLYWTAVAYSVVAAAINMPHVLDHLAQHGIEDSTRWFYMITPDALLFVGLILAKYLRRHPLGWTMLALGVSWLVWAGLSDAEASASARSLAVAPVLVGVLFALAVDATKVKVVEVAPVVAASEPVVEAPATSSTEAVVAVVEPVVEAKPAPVVKASRPATKAATSSRQEKAEARYRAFVTVVEGHPGAGPKELHLASGEPLGTVEKYLRRMREEAPEIVEEAV